MRISLVFNELSTTSVVSGSIAEGRQRMSAMLATISLATRKGMASGVDGLMQGMGTIILAPGYPVQRWLNDGKVNRDEQRLLGVCATKDPRTLADDLSDDCDVRCNKLLGEGIRRAYLLDLMTLSIRSDEFWDSPMLQVTVERLNDAEVDETNGEVPNACRDSHVEWNSVWIQKRLTDDLPTTAAELVDWVGESVPHLRFCDGWANAVVRSQHMARTVAVELAILEAHILQYGSEPFDIPQHRYPGRTSLESAPTLEQYGNDRLFLCPDGQTRLFSQHLKVRADWRIHIFPVPDQGYCYVGYTGRHLRTVQDHT